MAHVIVLDSINEDIFVCGVCKSVFNSLQVYVDHKTFTCTNNVLEESLVDSSIVQTTVVTDAFCGNIDSVQQSTELSDSVATNNKLTGAEDHNCMSCKKKFKKMKSLLSHMKIHHEKPYQCPVCGRCFIQNSHLQRHITTHKIWPEGLNHTTAKTTAADLLSYSCLYCNVILPNYSQYRAHLKNHITIKKFKCIQGDCMEFFDTVNGLLQHVNISHETLVYTCHLCNSTFNSLEEIGSHQHNHNNSGSKEPSKKRKLFKCNQCDAEFRKSEKLTLHMLTENHSKVCIHCNKTFASDKRLRLHLQIHKNVKQFQCNICNSSFHMKKYLTTHMLKHGNRLFKCTVCKYTFKRSDLLQRHMKLHQAKKMFKCPFRESLDCKKEFSRSDKLKLHIKNHTKNLTMNSMSKTKESQIIRPKENCGVLMNTDIDTK